MSPVRRGVVSDGESIASRVAHQLARDAHHEPLINATFDRAELIRALGSSPETFWVDDAAGDLRGHLIGTTLTDDDGHRRTWTGPDGVSADTDAILEQLCLTAHEHWRQRGSRYHIVWSRFDGSERSWLALGYEVRALKAVRELSVHATTAPCHFRRATVEDLEVVLAFQEMIDQAQGHVDMVERTIEVRRLRELLDDEENIVTFAEVDGRVVGQVMTMELPPVRGSYAGTVLICDTAVDTVFRRCSIGRALVAHACAEAQALGRRYGEVRWHANNMAASAFWSSLGFRPTYARLEISLN